MSNSSSVTFGYLGHYGMTVLDAPEYTGPVPDGFTFNSPVGLCMDRCQQIWVCDTGNNRIVILDRAMERIVRILHCPDVDGRGEAKRAFHMPFHVCPHPAKNRVYITDIGNGRVVAMDYGQGEFRFAMAFGQDGDEEQNLQDPNGIAVVKQKNGHYAIHVNDEFFHTPGDDGDKRNRCVRFDEHGKYVDEFRTVIGPDGKHHDLFWPQGLAADSHGNLYIANTGSYEILKCSAAAPSRDRTRAVMAKTPVVPHSFTAPRGIGMLNIMRYVNVIGDRMFVPDHIANTISVFDLDGKLESSIVGMRPSWNHNHQEVDSATDPLYYALENVALVGPYVICQGEAPDIFLVSEPFCSRILKLRIAGLDLPIATGKILAAVGSRRDETGKRQDNPQFDCVTSVIGLQHDDTRPGPDHFDPLAELPPWLRYNPLQYGLMDLSKLCAEQYATWFDIGRRLLPSAVKPLPPSLRLNLDAGNWEIRNFDSSGSGTDYAAVPSQLDGWFAPGNLAMAVHHPRQPLLGQLCPGTPLLLVSNFNYNLISMYQFGPQGQLLNYGLPFGLTCGALPGLHGPQGLSISDDGEIYVADTLNNRMTQWQLLQTGQVAFVRDFTWPKRHGDGAEYPFIPTDVEVDQRNRVFVTDQFNDRICVFDRNGAPLWNTGQSGYWEEGQADGERFMLPTSIAIDGDLLLVNDLVNRALKAFRIGEDGLEFVGGISLFKRGVLEGGVWMPFFMYARDRQLFVADSTYNVVQVYSY